MIVLLNGFLRLLKMRNQLLRHRIGLVSQGLLQGILELFKLIDSALLLQFDEFIQG